MSVLSLESLATSARTSLTDQVAVRLSSLLASPDTDAHVRTSLTNAITGFGQDGVVERAAYSWFNRLTAARFMDAHAYSGTYQAVTPPPGSNQPECLVQARQGSFDYKIDPQVQSQVTDLLLAGKDRQAYVTLLTAYFQLWSKAMPAVFPHANSWVNYLAPGDLLSATSVRLDIVQAMDQDACKDVEVIGWLYQYYISQVKAEINDSKKKITAKELAPVTQLFTPHWIVRYLVENTVGKQWLRAHPSSPLREQMEYLVPSAQGQEDAGLAIGDPTEFRIVDPACGSAHMLTYTFDLLWQMYVEAGYSSSKIANLIFTHNLTGIEIDRRAVQLASFALAMKAQEHDRRYLERSGVASPNIVHIRSVAIPPISPEQYQRICDQLAGSAEQLPSLKELNKLIDQLGEASTFGSLIQPPAGAYEVLQQLTNVADPALMGTDPDELAAAATIAKALHNSQYTAVVANPPYLGSKHHSPLLKKFLGKGYTAHKADLITCFMTRGRTLVQDAGAWGMLTLNNWMFLSSFENSRKQLLNENTISTFTMLGRGICGVAMDFCVFTCINTPPSERTEIQFIHLADRAETPSDEMRTGRFFDALKGKNRDRVYQKRVDDLEAIPGSPIVYWLPDALLDAFRNGTPLGEIASPRQGLATADNDRFLRLWWEVGQANSYLHAKDKQDAIDSGKKWFPHNKGGSFRKWYGNQDYVVNWENDGEEIINFVDEAGEQRSRPQNTEFYFKPCISWSDVSSGTIAFRAYPEGYVFDAAGPSIFPDREEQLTLISFLNSGVASELLTAFSSGLHFSVGHVSKVPIPKESIPNTKIIDELISLFKSDLMETETANSFSANLSHIHQDLSRTFEIDFQRAIENTNYARLLELQNNNHWANVVGIERPEESLSLNQVSLLQNPYFAFAPEKGQTRSEEEYRWLFFQRAAQELISYIIGLWFGRYSLDKPGLILADQGASLQDYLAQVPEPTLIPDDDGIIPFTDGYFADDALLRVQEAIKAIYGEENLEENLAFLVQCLNVKSSGKKSEFTAPTLPTNYREGLFKYLDKEFLKTHEAMYSNRPIYWMFQSPKGYFKALIYQHRYTAATAGQVLAKYAVPYRNALTTEVKDLQAQLDSAARSQQAALRKRLKWVETALADVTAYIDDSLYPLSIRKVSIDLDDGVRVNYNKVAYGISGNREQLKKSALRPQKGFSDWYKKRKKAGTQFWQE